jgi:hypothetical protein
LFANRVFWEYFDAYSAFISFLNAFGALIFKLFLDFLAFKFLLDTTKQQIIRPKIWSWYFIISTSLGFIAGIFSAFTRLIVFTIYTMAAIFRVERTILPEKLQEYGDRAYTGFMSYLYALHCHENPVWAVAVDSLKQLKMNQRSSEVFSDELEYKGLISSQTIEYQNRARLRWKLAYTLLIDPSLQKYRSHPPEEIPRRLGRN